VTAAPNSLRLRPVSVEMNARLDDIDPRGTFGNIEPQCWPINAGSAQILDVVIYEEDQLTRNLLQEWLGEAGYRVRTGALREAQWPRADLVIASIYMPKQSGSSWVRDIQAVHPGSPLIAISGQFRSGLRAAGATAQVLGVQQVIAKPLIRADLMAAVRGMIGTPL
jgi:DNA-binding response OmpR family regulator